MNRRSLYQLRRMNWRRGARKTAASDEPTVHWREPSVYPVVMLEQDRDAPRWSLKHRMNRRVSSGSSHGRVEATKEVLAAGSSAPDDPTVRRSIASKQLCQRSCAVEATASSTEWTDAQKKIASDHLMVLLSAAFSKWLVWCLGLLIPPPLAHLRLLDWVAVQESARHLQDNIQSIQVLNCSSIDLRMLSVCA
jgi:hypothetical protein